MRILELAYLIVKLERLSSEALESKNLLLDKEIKRYQKINTTKRAVINHLINNYIHQFTKGTP